MHNKRRFWGQKFIKKRAGTSKPFWECTAQSAGSRHTTNVHSETWQKSPSERCVSVLFDLSLPRVCQVCELPFLFHYSYVTSSYIYFQNFAMSCNGFAKIWFLKVQSLKLLDFLSFWRPRVHGLCKFVPDNAIIFRCQKVTFSKSCFLKPINYVHI